MARRARKHGRRSTTRRRRIGAMALNAKSPMVQIGSLAIGFLMGDQINAMVDKVTGTMDAKLVGAAEGGLGAALMFMKIGAKKSALEVGAGGVLAGAGVKRLLKAFGVINGIGGYQSVPVIGRKMLPASSMQGYGAVPVVSGYQVPRLNGVFNGYKVPGNSVMGSIGSSGLTTGSDCMG